MPRFIIEVWTGSKFLVSGESFASEQEADAVRMQFWGDNARVVAVEDGAGQVRSYLYGDGSAWEAAQAGWAI